MVAIVVMAYVLSIQQGFKNKDDKKKIYKNKPSRLAISYFKQGLSIVKAKVWNLKILIGVLNDIFKMLTKVNSCMSSSKELLSEMCGRPHPYKNDRYESFDCEKFYQNSENWVKAQNH
jgi:hypothetical protein